MRRTGGSRMGRLLAAVGLLAGVVGPAAAQEKTIRVARQYGLWDAMAAVAVERKLIEKYAPGWKVEGGRFGSGPALREAMIAGRVEVGIMGFAPFVIGWDKGIKWKVADVMTQYRHKLVANHKDIKSIQEFVKLAKSKPGFKIGNPAPGSSNHIALQWYLKRNGLDPRSLDPYLVALPHPEAYLSLKNGQIDAHITSPPYDVREVREGMNQVAILWPTKDGWMPNAVVAVMEDWAAKHPEAFAAVVLGMEEAAVWTMTQPREAARLLAADLKLTPEETLDIMVHENKYAMGGVDLEEHLIEYIKFMREVGLVKNVPKGIEDFAFFPVAKFGIHDYRK